MPQPRTRVDSILSPDAYDTLQRIMDTHDVPKRTALERAIGIAATILDHQNEGNNWMLRYRNGDREIVRFLF